MPNMSEIESIALFDLDNTLCDHETTLLRDLNSLKSPNEPEVVSTHNLPDYLKKRADAIRSQMSWWENLPKLQHGWDVLKLAQSLDYNIEILTTGPKRFPLSWMGKKLWVDKYFGKNTNLTITRDKGNKYGRVLVDDSVENAKRWLSWRERGLVIMPLTKYNPDFKHSQVIKYDGTNLETIKKAMERARDRKRGQELNLSDLK